MNIARFLDLHHLSNNSKGNNLTVIPSVAIMALGTLTFGRLSRALTATLPFHLEANDIKKNKILRNLDNENFKRQNYGL